LIKFICGGETFIVSSRKFYYFDYLLEINNTLVELTLVNSHHIVPGLGKITTQMKFTQTQRFLGGDKMLRGRVDS